MEGVCFIREALRKREMVFVDDDLLIKETAEKWDVSIRWVQTLCATGKIEGAIKFGRDWAVPKDAEKPDDSRVKSGKYKGWRDKKNSSERTG